MERTNKLGIKILSERSIVFTFNLISGLLLLLIISNSVIVTFMYSQAKGIEESRTYFLKTLEWGSLGSGDGEFRIPHSIVFD
jgi:hypothetical protein